MFAKRWLQSAVVAACLAGTLLVLIPAAASAYVPPYSRQARSCEYRVARARARLSRDSARWGDRSIQARHDREQLRFVQNECFGR
jgi:hypothetical protein